MRLFVTREADNWLPDTGDFFAVLHGMRDAVPDRRRIPRVEISDAQLSVMAFPSPVRLLDISMSGVLLESTRPVDLGARGTLRFNLGGEPFSADVKVERVERARPEMGADRYAIGASFVALSRQDERVIERFALE